MQAETLTYTGIVTDKLTGKVIAGATVTVRRRILAPFEDRIIEEPKYTTDAEGKYTYTIPPEQVAERFLFIDLDVSHPDYATKNGFGYALGMIRKNEKFGERPFFEHVELYPAESIMGTVVKPEGKPATGIKVLGIAMYDTKDLESASFTETATDSEGTFRLNLAKKSKAVFWLLPKDYAPSTQVIDEKRGDQGRFELEKGIELSGRVVDEQEKPVPGVWVNAEIVGGPAKKPIAIPVGDALARSALTDENGAFTLAPLPAGECMIKVDDYPRDYLLARQSRRAPPGVFSPKKVRLKKGKVAAPVEIRAVPQVVIEGQFYDSQGKPRLGHEPYLWGRIDESRSLNLLQLAVSRVRPIKKSREPGNFCKVQGIMDKNGRFILRAPKGLKEAKLNFGSNEYGALRVRMEKDGPLSNQCRDIDLGTLDKDLQGIEVVRYEAPILLVKPVAEDGTLLPEAKVEIEYTEGRGIWDIQGRFVEGKHVHFQKQGDGRRRSEQLLPDEEFTLTVEAEGYEPKAEKLKLPEGAVKELELHLKKTFEWLRSEELGWQSMPQTID